MMKLVAALVVAFLCAGAAHAQMACGQPADFIENLKKQFGESPAFEGISRTGPMVVVTASAKGTWTLFVIRPDGIACVLDGGDDSAVTPIPDDPAGKKDL